MKHEIKRYDMFYDDWVRTWDYEEADDGDWVKYEDVNKIRAQAVRDAALNISLLAVCDSMQLMQYADEIERGEI